MGSRTWIKIHCEPWLNGSLRNLSPYERGLWIDLLVLAGNGSYGDLGIISITKFHGLSDGELSKIMGTSKAKWKLSKKLFSSLNMITVKNGEGYRNVIIINNWNKYQSEYGRQKSYRHKLQPHSVTQSYNREVDREEKENKMRKTGSTYVDKILEEMENKKPLKMSGQ